jgi:hypothetical protein
MRVLVGSAQRGPVLSSAVLLTALGILTVTVVGDLPLRQVAPVVAGVVLATVAYRWALQWHVLLAGIILVILFIPIRRYALPGNLPFELEPYRLVVALIAAGWVASLLVDPRVRLRRSGLEAPLVLIVIAILGSLLVNPGRVSSVEPEVVKNFMFFVSFFVVLYLFASAVRVEHTLDALVKVLVGGGAVVAVFAVIEARNGYNLFNHLSGFIPLLEPINVPGSDLQRGARLRVFASAQHPIALGAALVMLIPLAAYLVGRTRQRLWWIAFVLLTLGALATVSRTSVVMLMVVGLVFLWLRPVETKRFWPLLLPALLLVHFALPGTIGTLKGAFTPAGGLIEEQRKGEGGRGSGRVADLGPALHNEFAVQPVFGQGFGTRIVDIGPKENAQILDNQWLVTLLETGAAGFAGWIWLFARFIRRLGRRAKRDPTDLGWLATALTASVTAYAVGMFFYDAFSFYQVTFFLFIMLGLGSALLASTAERRIAAPS